MDKDQKITLSLFLTWVVFGLFNLFGQPQAFVPLIIVDGIFVTGLALYFLNPFFKNGFYFALIPLIIIFSLLSLIETNWIIPDYFIGIILTASCITFLGIMAYSVVKAKFLSRLEKWAGIIIPLLMTTGFIFAFAKIELSSEIYFVNYILLGIFCFISVIMVKSKNHESFYLKRIFLVLLLNFLYDFGNYLALLQFSGY